jgi:glutamine amidotransferase
MCRIVLYASSEGRSKIMQVFRCFKLASTYDFVLDTFRRGRRSHNHGWGYAYLYKFRNDIGYMVYKSSLPISFNEIKLAVPRYFEWILMVMHSRLTHEEPIDIVNTHPHSFSKAGKVSIWFVHNGSVDKERLAKDIGLEGMVKNYSDSYILTQWLGENIKSLSSKELIDLITKVIDLGVVKSALNIAAILMDEVEKKVLGIAMNYVVKEYTNLYDYYALHIVEIGDRTKIIASSTVAYYLNSIYGYRTKVLENGTVIILHPVKEAIQIEVLNVAK